MVTLYAVLLDSQNRRTTRLDQRGRSNSNAPDLAHRSVIQLCIPKKT